MSLQRKKAEIELERKYPIGGCPLFPLKRVWHNNKNDTYFELTPLRIKVWATAIVNFPSISTSSAEHAPRQAGNTADQSAPPTSIHFADDKKMKIPSSVQRPPPDAPLSAFGDFYRQRQQEQAADAIQAPLPPPGLFPQLQPQFPGLHAPMGFPPPQHGYHPYYPPAYMPPAYTYPVPPYYPAGPQGQPPAAVDPPSTSSSPSVTTTHNVSLAEFCVKYRLSDGDQAKLAALEYQPGNRGVEKLDEREWRDIGKFTKLGWQSFMDAHKKFCKAIKSGNWS